MKKLLLLLSFVTIAVISNSQITKGNWIVGGSGNFLSSKMIYVSPNLSTTQDRIDVKVSTTIGYFVVGKFSLGLKPSYSKSKAVVEGSGGNINTNENRFEFGPFVRYYFLKADQQYNILLDLSYQYGFYWFKPAKGNINTFSASIGPVIYFNSTVGLEFLLGYYNRKEDITINTNSDFVTQQKGFQIGIGFQIHLENDR
jgi:hypothetical protein